MLTGITAITLATHDMARAVAYEALGFVLKFGGPAANFTSFRVGNGYLNLMSVLRQHLWGQWGRAIFYVDDVDASLPGHDLAPRACRQAEKLEVSINDRIEFVVSNEICGGICDEALSQVGRAGN